MCRFQWKGIIFFLTMFFPLLMLTPSAFFAHPENQPVFWWQNLGLFGGGSFRGRNSTEACWGLEKIGSTEAGLGLTLWGGRALEILRLLKEVAAMTNSRQAVKIGRDQHPGRKVGVTTSWDPEDGGVGWAWRSCWCSSSRCIENNPQREWLKNNSNHFFISFMSEEFRQGALC